MDNDNRHNHNVNDIDYNDMKIDVNTLAQFKRHLQEKDSVKIKNEKYLVDGCENPNDDKSNILGW